MPICWQSIAVIQRSDFRHGTTDFFHYMPMYGVKTKYDEPQDEAFPLRKDEKHFIQEVRGTFLYYGRAVGSTLLTALSTIVT